MPKSKRAQVVSLTKVKRKNRSRKEDLVATIHTALDQYARTFVFEIENSKTVHLQHIRSVMKPSKLLFGKNKVMMVALGNDEQSEAADRIHKLTKYLKGPRGLIFSNSTPQELNKILESISPDEYAKSGFIATETVVLKEGSEALAQFPHSMEAELRKLGLPTLLKSAAIYLMGDSTVCTKGVPLTVEAAQLLKLLDIRMAKFRMRLIASWEKATGDIEEF